MSIMVDGCMNCHKDKSTHMPDGSCLFDSTKFKPYPSVVFYPPFPYAWVKETEARALQSQRDKARDRRPFWKKWWSSLLRYLSDYHY